MDRSNAISGIFISIFTILLEVWMIAKVVHNIFFGGKVRTVEWIINHLSSYIVLLISAIIMLIYSICCLRGKRISSALGRIVRYGFSLICLAFGIYIGYLDYAKGNQAFAFNTMMVFVFGFLAWRPYSALIMVTASFLVFLYYCNTVKPIDEGFKINSFTLWLALLMTSINLYVQKMMGIQKDESLEHINAYLKEKTMRDDLTGIPNMHYFRNKTLTALMGPPEELAKLVFLFLDIENFKSYNARYGFAMGNELLKKVAEAIRTVFEFALIARFSDDHFVILTERNGIESRLDDVRKIMCDGEVEVQLGLKVGAYTPPNGDVPPSIACDRARFACNSIKKKYGKYFCEYTEEMDKAFYRRQYVINNVDKAVKEGWIKVFYQPVVYAEDKRLCGVEALARWDDPEYGLIPPSDFVPVLEEYRQIHKLDLCILKNVCNDISKAQRAGDYFVPVSINFSRLDFELVDVLAMVEDCLHEYSVSKSQIHVEITESALNENDVQLVNAIESFRKHGYALWLDDFGSGYSGLNVLKDFQFDMMKIDMQFLRNFSGNDKIRPILKSIVNLAKDISMHTLTEGVETEEAFEYLRSIGCERMQGYLFGKPMPKEELLEKIHSGIYTVYR
ncbi:MAG: EAL domain-containing protein [Treponema sp.]|nr:EAL domain-containing protein [Treponema sp.]